MSPQLVFRVAPIAAMQHKKVETGSRLDPWERKKVVQAKCLRIEAYAKTALRVVRTLSLTEVDITTTQEGAADGSD
jgi:phage gp46-like protein